MVPTDENWRKSVGNRQPAVIVHMDGTLCDVSTMVHLQAEPDGLALFHQASLGEALEALAT